MSDKPKSACGYKRGEWRTKAYFRAECLTCGKTWSSSNALGVAAVHARTHHHATRVEIDRTAIYNHEP